MTRKRKTRKSRVPAGPNRRRPSRNAFVTAASLLAATVLVEAGLLQQLVGSFIDAGVQHIIALILTFSAVMSLLLWFVFQSGQPASLRWGLLSAVAAVVLAGVATLRVERVSGDLVPKFAWRWSPPRDRLLPNASETAVVGPSRSRDAAAWAATPHDYPRFLGPAQSLSLDGPAIDPDWVARPPKPLWRRPIGAGWGAFAACGERAVTLEQRGDDEVIACYAIDTGQPQWVVPTRARHETVLGGVGPRSTPAIDEGVVFTAGATGWIHAIDAATGAVIWRKNVLDVLGINPAKHEAAVAWGRAGSPLVSGSLVIVPGGGPREGGPVSLLALDRTDGSTVWTAGDSQIAYASPTEVEIGGRKLVMAVNEAEVAGYDLADGRLTWRFDWDGHSNSDASCSQAVLLPEDEGGGRDIFVSKGYGFGCAVFRLEPGGTAPWPVSRRWHEPSLMKTKFTNVAVHDGHAYGLSDGILECVRLSDGKRAWKGGRYGQGQVLRVADILLVQAESGEVAAVGCRPVRFEELARFDAVRGQTWNNLCLSGRRLLVRSAEEAACYELPAAAGVAVRP